MRFLMVGLLTLLILGSTAASPPVAAGPKAYPYDVVILGPNDSPRVPQTVHGMVTVVATPPMSAKVARVGIFLDGNALAPTSCDKIGRYVTQFDSTRSSNGNHTLKAVGTDARKSQAWTARTEVEVRNTVASARVDLKIEGKQFRIGQPIPYQMSVTNLSKHDVQYMDCGKGHERLLLGYTIEVVNTQGKEPRRPGQLPYSIACGYAKLAPGASLVSRGYLNQWFILDQPGTYRITASWAPSSLETPSQPAITSQQWRITAVPASQKERDGLFGNAREKLEAAKTAGERIDALWPLAFTLDDRAVPVLKKIWKGMDETVRWEALGSLMAMGTPAAQQALQNTPATDPKAYERLAK